MICVRRIWIIVMLWLGIQAASGQAQEGRPFPLDTRRPFVDLIFDRVGQWIPVFPNESSKGVWLKLRNNCPYSIAIEVLTIPTKNAGPLIVHEVHEIQSAVPAPPGGLSSTIPKISNHYLGGDVRNTLELLPGREMSFGFPAEHISPFASIKVNFVIQFPSAVSGRQPRTFLEYFWIDLPAQARLMIEKANSADSGLD